MRNDPSARELIGLSGRCMGQSKACNPGGHLAAAMIALALAGCSEAGEQAATPKPENTVASRLRAPDVRYQPSPHKVVRAMLELAQVTERDLVYDLGSGDGRIPIAAARDFGARGVGIEIDPKLVARSRENARKAGVTDRVTFRNEDLFTADFHDATVVALFLYPDVNMKLRPKLLTTLRPGTRVVSHYHSMGDWRPKAKIRVEGRAIFLWVVPAAGRSGGPASQQPTPSSSVRSPAGPDLGSRVKRPLAPYGQLICEVS